MDLGFFTMPLHPEKRPLVETMAEDREAFLLADQLGYTEAYMGEHVTDTFEPIPSSMLWVAWVAEATKNIKLGTGTVNLGHHHPAATAVEIALLDHMLKGRFLFGVSPGNLPSDSEVFGTLNIDRNARFIEALDAILTIWTTEAPYDIKGDTWSISTMKTFHKELGQGIMLKPYQKPHPPILGTVVAPYSKGVIGLGERGWYAISANFLQPAWVATHWPNFAQGCQNVGRVPNPQDWRVARSIFVADDEKTAQAYGKGPDSPYRFYYKQLGTKLLKGNRHNLFKNRVDQPDSEVTLDFMVDSLVIAGTVDSVVEQIMAFREQVGDFGTLVYAGHDWVDAKLGRRSMELMATEVMPRINKAIGHRAAAAQ